MKWLLVLLLSAMVACSSGPSSMGRGVLTTAHVVPTKLLHSFHDASSISFDQFLNLYVVETSTNSVMKLSATGDSIRNVSGFGMDHNQFNAPVDVDARLTNSVFVADNFNHRIEQYTKELTYVSTLHTREAREPAQRFGYPKAVAADDAGNVYIADGENKRVVKVRPDYTVDRTIGGYGEATRPEATLTNPVDLAVDRDEHLIVLDNGGSSLVTFDNLGNLLVRREVGVVATSIAAANDTVFVLVASDRSVRLYLSSGLTEVATWHIGSGSFSDLSPLTGLAVRSGSVCIATRQGVYSCKVHSTAPDTSTHP